jgi:hypothetical protein
MTLAAMVSLLTLPHQLTLVYAFVSCLVAGTLVIGEGIIFMLLYNISRSYGLFGDNTSRFKGVLLSQVISACSQLPIVFAGRHEMSTVLGYGLCMVVVSLSFITMGVGMLLSGHESEALMYAAAFFMLFSFYQLLKVAFEFGEERLGSNSDAAEPAQLDASGTYVISHQKNTIEAVGIPYRHVAMLVRVIRQQPHCLAPLYHVGARADADVCARFIQSCVFADDGTASSDQKLSCCIAALITNEVSFCKDLTTLLREDSLASKMVGLYCRRRQSLAALSQILDPIFDGIIRECPAPIADPLSVSLQLPAALTNIIAAICSRSHQLPLGVQQSTAALLRALHENQLHTNQPLSVASAAGSIVFLRCIVRDCLTTPYAFCNTFTRYRTSPSNTAPVTLHPSVYSQTLHLLSKK